MEPVLVFKGDRIRVEMAQQLLKNHQIPCLVQSQHGAGFVIRAGGILEEYRLYVNPEHAETAQELCANFCAADEN